MIQRKIMILITKQQSQSWVQLLLEHCEENPAIKYIAQQEKQ